MTLTTSYPDLLSYRQRIRTTTALKTRLDSVSQEAITGLKSDVTAATKGRVGTAYLMQKALNDIEQDKRINAITTSRFNLMTRGLEGARIAFSGLGTQAIVAINSDLEPDIKSISDTAAQNLRSVMASLNSKQGARSLFNGTVTDKNTYSGPDELVAQVASIIKTAGDATDIEAALDTFFNDPNGGFETLIYNGSQDETPPIRVGNNLTLQVDIRGNNKAFKDTLRGLSVMAAAFEIPGGMDNDGFASVFNSAINHVTSGEAGLIDLQAEMGNFGAEVEKANDHNQAEALTITTAYQSIIGRDQFEAAAELQQLQTQLESSYLLTNRLSQLTLTNFLR